MALTRPRGSRDARDLSCRNWPTRCREGGGLPKFVEAPGGLLSGGEARGSGRRRARARGRQPDDGAGRCNRGALTGEVQNAGGGELHRGCERAGCDPCQEARTEGERSSSDRLEHRLRRGGSGQPGVAWRPKAEIGRAQAGSQSAADFASLNGVRQRFGAGVEPPSRVHRRGTRRGAGARAQCGPGICDEGRPRRPPACPR